MLRDVYMVSVHRGSM